MYWRSDGSMWSFIVSSLRLCLLCRLRPAQEFLRSHQLSRIDDDLVIGCEHLMNGGEVASTSTQRVADDAEDHAEPGTDQHRGTDERQGSRVVREQEQDQAEEQAEPGTAGRSGARGTRVGELAGDPLHRLQIIADDRKLLDR